MNDSAPQFFEADGLLPEQFFADIPYDPNCESERQLMLAILRDAVECHQKYARSRDFRTRQLFNEAREWIFKEDREWPFSYVNICDVLGVDPEYIRGGLARMAPRGAHNSRRRPKIVSLGAQRGASRPGDTRQMPFDQRKAS